MYITPSLRLLSGNVRLQLLVPLALEKTSLPLANAEPFQYWLSDSRWMLT